METYLTRLLCGGLTASLALLSPYLRAQTCPSGIVSYWSLNESGTSFSDGPGSNNGGCGTACPTATSGVISGAQSFNGIDQEIVVPNSSSFNFDSNDSFSLEIWYKADGGGAGTEVFLGRTEDFDSGMQWFIGRNNANKPRFDIKDSNDNSGSLTDPEVPATGLWHHVVGVRNASSDTLLLYVDGELKASASDNFTGNFGSAAAVHIGHLRSAAHFEGALDEAAIYSRALSADEVFLHHANGVTLGLPVCFTGCEGPIVLPTFQPEEMQRTCEGGDLSLEVRAVGSPNLSYQWFQDGNAVSGATSRVLSISGGTADMSGNYTVEVSNSCGMDESEPGMLTFDSGPVMNLHPVDTTACEGGVALFIIEAGPVTSDYQWFHNGNPIPGDFEPQLTIENVSAEDAGVYEVTVFNECGSVDSLPATLSVTEAPKITDHPDDASLCVGEPATFSVAATGSGQVTYEWFKDGEEISGAVDSVLTVQATVPGDAGVYQARVTDECSQVLSDAATLTLDVQPPEIAEQPVDQGACEGDEVVLSVSATGSGQLRYQWSKDGNTINGATSADLLIPSADQGDAGTYQVTVTDDCGRTTESDPRTLSVFDGAGISDQPDDADVCLGDPVTLSVSATGGPLTFQWRRDGEDIPGAIEESYVIGETGLEDAGNYQVVITGDCGPTESEIATVTVEAGPELTGQPDSAKACEGETVTFSIEVTGTEPINIQWRFNGTDIAGATAESYTIDSVTAEDYGSYDAVISNSCGTATSDSAVLSDCPGESGPVFKRGDSDGDGSLSIGDPIRNLAFQFLGQANPPCMDALDFDDNGDVALSDPVANLAHQFLGGAPPAPPGKDACGEDPTPDLDVPDLGCNNYPQDRC